MHFSISIRAKYLFFILLVAKELNLKEFNIREAFDSLNILKNDDLSYISDKFKTFNQSSKTNINYLTILKDSFNVIPDEVFVIMQKAVYIRKDKYVEIIFDNEYDKIIFERWKAVFTINKKIYDSEDALIKKILDNEKSSCIIQQNEKGNKSISFNQYGTNSFATKQYNYTDSSGELITIFNNKNYIDFYDVFNRYSKNLFNEKECVENIFEKICKNDIIIKLGSEKFPFLKDDIEKKVRDIFFK